MGTSRRLLAARDSRSRFRPCTAVSGRCGSAGGDEFVFALPLLECGFGCRAEKAGG